MKPEKQELNVYKEFLPYIEDIFTQYLHQKKSIRSPLIIYDYQNEVNLKLAPEQGIDEGALG